MKTMSDVLKKAIAESGYSHRSLELATGVKRASIMRFMRGETSLRLDMAEKLAGHLGLVLTKREKGQQHGKHR